MPQYPLPNICAVNTLLFSPICQLPDEILGKIFTQVLCGEVIDVGTKLGPIWDLRKVCVRWREILEDIPFLWNKLHVEEIELDSVDIVVRIHTCLNFSKTKPLSIFYRPTRPDEFPVQAMNNLANQAYRWDHLSLDITALNRVKEITSLEVAIQNHGNSQLRSLTIYGTCKGEVRCPLDILWHSDILEITPLRNVTVSDILEVPSWDKLQKFTFDGCILESGDALTSRLRFMPLLEELSAFNNTSPLAPVSRVVTIPLLHTLEVNEDDMSQICRGIRVPRLTNISIMGRFDDTHHLLEMVERSRSIVKRLHLISCVVDPLTPQLFRSLRDTEELSLMGMSWNAPELLQELIWKPNVTNGRLFPLLRKLELLCKRGRGTLGDDIIQPLMDVMRSRSPDSVAPLQFIKCTVLVIPSWYDKYVIAFRELKIFGENLGMEFEVALTMEQDNEEIEVFSFKDNTYYPLNIL